MCFLWKLNNLKLGCVMQVRGKGKCGELVVAQIDGLRGLFTIGQKLYH